MDLDLLRAIAEHRTALLDTAAGGLFAVGVSLPLLAAAALVGLAVVVLRRAWRAAVAGALAAVVAVVVAGALKQVVERPRPPDALSLHPLGGFAMPSTHAALTSALAVAVAVAWPWASARTAVVGRVLIAAAVVVVGAAMVYLGVHWATDVLAGWSLGSLVGGGLGLVLRQRVRVSAA